MSCVQKTIALIKIALIKSLLKDFLKLTKKPHYFKEHKVKIALIKGSVLYYTTALIKVSLYLVGCIVQKRINICANVDYTTKVTFCQKIAGSHQQLEYYYIRNLPYGSYGIAQQVKCFLTFSNLI